MDEEEYHKECDVPNTEILKALVESAQTEEVKEIILLYETSKPGRQIKKDLNSSSLKNLIEAGEFFKIINAKLFKTKATLVGKIIQAIENLLMQKCGECTQYYSIEYGTTPTLSCRKCGQGAHSHCYDDHQIRAGISLVYTCSLCSTKVKPDELDASQAPPTQRPTQKLPPVNNDLEERNEDVDDESSDDEDEESSDKKYEITENTCKFFLKTSCKTGLKGRNCKYDHLPICNKLLRNGIKGPYGCKQGKDCPYYHPHMCRESLRSKTCSREYCKYYHVQGTVKTGENEVFQQYEESSQAYNSNPATSPKEPSDSFLGMFKQLQQQVMSIQNQLGALAQPKPLQQRIPAPPAQQVQQPTSTPHQPQIVYQYLPPTAQKQSQQPLQSNPIQTTYNQLYPLLPPM